MKAQWLLVVCFAVVSTLAALVAVSDSALSDPNDLNFRQIRPELANYGGVDWEARWDRQRITVCWLDHPEYVEQRALVQKSVAESWESVSSIRFVGWKDCTSAGADVRIRVDESGPRSHVGMHSVGLSPSMWLNFTFNAWGTQRCLPKVDACIKAIAVHEFGHAAGLEHEQLHPDAPQECIDFLKANGQWEGVGKKPKWLTPYDPDSVMNYCNAIFYSNPVLSKNDQIAIALLFPKG